MCGSAEIARIQRKPGIRKQRVSPPLIPSLPPHAVRRTERPLHLLIHAYWNDGALRGAVARQTASLPANYANANRPRMGADGRTGSGGMRQSQPPLHYEGEPAAGGFHRSDTGSPPLRLCFNPRTDFQEGNIRYDRDSVSTFDYCANINSEYATWWVRQAFPLPLQITAAPQFASPLQHDH